jgi:hypothetical protein
MFVEQLLVMNGNKWIAGIAMLLVNLGAKHIQGDLSKTHEMILSNEYIKKLIIFALFFMATRDIITAFILTLIYIFIIDGILHGDRKFCIIPKKYIPQPNTNEYKKAKDIVKKYESFINKESDNDLYKKYLSNLSKI